MGGNALLCGVLCLTLPETANQPTLETIEELKSVKSDTSSSEEKTDGECNKNVPDEEKAALVPSVCFSDGSVHPNLS